MIRIFQNNGIILKIKKVIPNYMNEIMDKFKVNRKNQLYLQIYTCMYTYTSYQDNSRIKHNTLKLNL